MARIFRTDDTDYWADRYGDGSDGAITISSNTAFSAANATCTGTGGTTTLTLGSASTFSNGMIVLIHQTYGTGAGTWEFNKISSGGGTTSLTMSYNLTATWNSGAQVIAVKQYSTVTVNSGQTWTAPSWDGSKGGIMAIFALQSMSIVGNISANGSGFAGGAGGLAVTPRAGVQGDSSTGTGSRSTSANGTGGGGGGVGTPTGSDAGGGGGGGGYATSGNNGTNDNQSPVGSGGTAGGSAGVASLVTAFFGGAGGGGGIDDSTSGGVGGNSGGFVVLVAPVITVSGTVTTNGANGTSHGDSGGGGGGGAGGSLLIKGQQVTVGSNLVAAGGGFGASGNAAFGGVGGNGGNGSAGRIHIDYSQLLSGSSNSPAFDSSVDAILNDLPNLQNYTLLM